MLARLIVEFLIDKFNVRHPFNKTGWKACKRIYC